jgi:hypothetical protein
MRVLPLAAACVGAAEVAAFSMASTSSAILYGMRSATLVPLPLNNGLRRGQDVRQSRREDVLPCRMQGLEGLFSTPTTSSKDDDPFNPVRPDPATMNPKIVGLMEDFGAMKDGKWLSEEELLVEWEKLYPGWKVAAWPLGSIDVGHFDARERLVTPELGGDPFAWPMGSPPRVICVGEMLIDAIAIDAKVKPGDPAEKWLACAGGAPANVACALAKLGTPVGFIGAVGDDDDGKKLLEVLKESNLPLQMVQTSTKPTRRVMVTKDASGNREFAGFEGSLKSDAYADTDIDTSKINGMWLYAADYLVTGTLSLAQEASRKALMELKYMADNIDMVWPVDVSWRPCACVRACV